MHQPSRRGLRVTQTTGRGRGALESEGGAHRHLHRFHNERQLQAIWGQGQGDPHKVHDEPRPQRVVRTDDVHRSGQRTDRRRGPLRRTPHGPRLHSQSVKTSRLMQHTLTQHPTQVQQPPPNGTP
jgi:hypothetical protein